MPALKWNEYEFIECLGVLPEKEEFFTSHYFRLVKDDLLFEMTIWQYDSCIAVSISKADDEKSFITIHFLVRDKAVFVNEKTSMKLRFQDCMIVSNRFWMSRDDDKKDYFDKSKFPTKLDIELYTYPKIELKFE